MLMLMVVAHEVEMEGGRRTGKHASACRSLESRADAPQNRRRRGMGAAVRRAHVDTECNKQGMQLCVVDVDVRW